MVVGSNGSCKPLFDTNQTDLKMLENTKILKNALIIRANSLSMQIFRNPSTEITWDAPVNVPKICPLDLKNIE